MPNLRFKVQKSHPERRTVQLVRYRYSSARKRGQTEYVGSLRLDADPDDLPHGLVLHAGHSLVGDELREVREWLLVHGDPVARERRAAYRCRIEAELRAGVVQNLVEETLSSALLAAVAAVEKAMDSIPEELASSGESGPDARKKLRTEYLALRHAWDALVKVAQTHGIAKVVSGRRSKDTADAVLAA